jgi:hypothetical protein
MFVLYYVFGINKWLLQCKGIGKYIYRIRFIYFVQSYKYIFEKHINIKMHYSILYQGFSVKK